MVWILFNEFICACLPAEANVAYIFFLSLYRISGVVAPELIEFTTNVRPEL